MLPPHRKHWAEAMLNETDYLETRRGALSWIIGCVFAAIEVRVTFELERTLMPHKVLKVIGVLGAAIAIGAIGIYVTAKPYQRERIWITLRQAVSSNYVHKSEDRNALASESPSNRMQRAGSP
jgi:hypothetical protein